jgi:hypothetical protein
LNTHQRGKVKKLNPDYVKAVSVNANNSPYFRHLVSHRPAGLWFSGRPETPAEISLIFPF